MLYVFCEMSAANVGSARYIKGASRKQRGYVARVKECDEGAAVRAEKSDVNATRRGFSRSA